MGLPVRVTVNGEPHDLDVEPRLLLVHLLRDTAGPDGHPRRLRHVQLRRVHRPPRRRGGQELHRAGRPGRRRPRDDDRGDGQGGRRAAPDAGGVLEQARPPVRLLHPGHDHGRSELLARNPNPTEHEIRTSLEGNLCRCTGYHNIVKAVLEAAKHPEGHKIPVPQSGGQDRRHDRGMEHERNDREARRQRLRRPRHAAQGGPAHDHGRGHTTSTTSTPHGTLYAAIVRSPEAHATIKRIDTSAARPATTSIAVFTGEDLHDLESPLPMAWAPPGVEMRTPDHWPLARGKVCHVGDPVAVVLGEDKYAVVDAAEEVDGRVRPAARSSPTRRRRSRTARRSSTRTFGTNESFQWSLGGGDLEAGFAEADKVVERRIVNHRTAGAAIEPRSMVAEWRGRRPDADHDHADPVHRALAAGRPARHLRGARSA